MAVVIQKRYPNVCKAISHDSVYGGTSSAHTKCARCNQILSSSHSYTQASSGTWNSSHSSVSATKSCSCGYSYSVSTSSIRESVDTESTCATNGRYEHTATLGSKTYKCPSWHTLALDPSNHSNGFSSRLTPSTCITKGHYTYTCKNGCGYSYDGADLALNSSNHEGSSIYGGTATCHTKYSCCGVTISASHDYGSQYEDVSWNSDCSACTGYYEACVCGYQESEDATSLIEINDIQIATCTTPGTYEHFVDDGDEFYCGKTHTGQKNPNNHTGSEFYVGIAEVHSCWSCCQVVYSTSHNWETSSLVGSPTFDCADDWVEWNEKCECGYVAVAETDAKIVEVTPSTCISHGSYNHRISLHGTTYTCGSYHELSSFDSSNHSGTKVPGSYISNSSGHYMYYEWNCCRAQAERSPSSGYDSHNYGVPYSYGNSRTHKVDCGTCGYTRTSPHYCSGKVDAVYYVCAGCGYRSTTAVGWQLLIL